MRLRRLLCFVVLMMMLFSNGLALANDNGAENTPLIRLRDCLVAVINSYERMYSDIQWYHEYMYTFNRTREWEDLQKARMALSTVLKDLRNLEVPKVDLEEWEYRTLEKEMDFEAGFMKDIGTEIASERNKLIEYCLNGIYALNDSVLTEKEWKQRIEHAKEIEDKAGIYYLQYLAFTVDWVTTQVRDEDWKRELNAQIAELCPLTNSNRIKGDITEEICQIYGSESLDRLVELLNKRTANLGKHEYVYDRYAKAVEQQNTEELEKDRMTIKGLPSMLPKADWEADPIDRNIPDVTTETPDWDKWIMQDYIYYWKTEDQGFLFPKVGDDLDRSPEGCTIVTKKVGREEVIDYYNVLLQEGILPMQEVQEEGPIELYYTLGESIMVLAWENDTASIYLLKNPVFFAPNWYIMAENATKNQ